MTEPHDRDLTIARLRLANRRCAAASVVGMIGFVVAIGVGLLGPASLLPIAASGLCVVLVVTIVLMFVFRPPAISCLACGRDHLGMAAMVVVASDHCPGCGARVLSDGLRPRAATLRPRAAFTHAARSTRERSAGLSDRVAVAALAPLFSIYAFLVIALATGASQLSPTALGIAIAIDLAVLAFVAFAVRREMAADRCRCSECRATLTAVLPIVVATGNCPSCGSVLVDEPRRRVPRRGTEALLRARRVTRRTVARVVVNGLAAYWVVMIAALFLSLGMRTLLQRGAYLQLAVLFGAAMLLLCPTAVWLVRRLEQRGRPKPPGCPDCDAPLERMGIVIAAGCCPACGDPIVDRLEDRPVTDDSRALVA